MGLLEVLTTSEQWVNIATLTEMGNPGQ